MKENKKVKNAIEKVENFIFDDEAKIFVELREKWQLDHDSFVADAKEDGIKIGLKEGIEKGIIEGKKEAQISTVKKLLELGMDIKQISSVTQLTKEEILRFKK